MQSDQSAENTSSNGNNPDENPSQPVASLPQFLSGNRRVSLAGLRERIETQFIAETTARAEWLLEADEAARRDLVREVTEYVLAVESLTLSRGERLAVLEVVYQDLFNFGPLASFLQDQTVTELTIDGPERIHVRYRAQEMSPVELVFDGNLHLERIVQRVLATARTQLTELDPVVEVGTLLSGRPARLTVFGPPVSPMIHVDVRLHPSQRSTLVGNVEAGLLDQSAADLLQTILADGHGLMIVGDVGTGKTTLLEALLPSLPSSGSGQTIVVERGAELRLPSEMERLTAIPPAHEQAPISFAEQIEAAVEKAPAWLVLDELRFDETQAMWHALTAKAAPRCLWAFRGATDPLRLRTAFSMSVRRAQPGIDQEFIHSALLDRLPFVAMLTHHDNQLKLLSVNQWQRDPEQTETLALSTIWPESDKPGSIPD